MDLQRIPLEKTEQTDVLEFEEVNKEELSMREVTNRDLSVEILRIIGCIIVVGVHVCLSSYVNGVYDESRLYIACLFADGVAVFWLIMGFFLFSNTDYGALLKKTIQSILVPLVFFSAFMFYFRDFIVTGETLGESVHHSLSEYKNVVRTVLTWNNPVNGCGHLWYLYVYLMLIFLFPVLKSFTDTIFEDEKKTKLFLLLSFAVLVINDITNNKLMAFSHHSINGAFPAAIEIMWGSYIYKNREIFTRKKYHWFLKGLGVFGGLNVVRCLIELYRGSVGENNSILYWYSSIGLICALALATIAFKFGDYLNGLGTFGKRVLLIVGKATFYIYLIHPLIRDFLNRLGLDSKLRSLDIYLGNGVPFEVSYTILKITIIFGISLIISIVIIFLSKFILLNMLRTKKGLC